jgi:hypothetical protein
MMRATSRAVLITVLAAILCILGSDAVARADLSNQGGPVLKSFEIVPYYYGPWNPADVTTHQNYLVGLAQYISGANAPANTQPMLVQYGVTSASVANAVIKTSVTTPIVLDTAAALAVIHKAQAIGTLPPYATNRLILLLLPHGATLTVHCGYHGAEATGKYYALVTQDCDPWLQVTAHEVFEAATDPAIGINPAWDEVVDPCSTSFSLWFGPVPGVFDNRIHSCSTNGYDGTPPSYAPGSFSAVWQLSTAPEIQVNGWTFGSYRQKYDELWGVGWRLHVLQPYVVNGRVLYNAVWQPSTEGEIQAYGWTYQDFRNKYDELWGQGRRLKILRPYVINGQVRYTAAWRPATDGEIQVYGWSDADYRAKYDQLSALGWRLQILQAY